MPTEQTITKLSLEKLIYRNATDLSHAEFRVLAVLMTYTDARGRNAFPALTNLIAETGCARSKVWAALKRLEELGYVVKTEQGGNAYGKGRANVYMIQVPEQAQERADAKARLRHPVENENASSTGAGKTGLKGSLTEHKGSLSERKGSLTGPHTGHHQIMDAKTPIARKADASHERSRARTIHHEDRAVIIDCIQQVAQTPGGNYSDAIDDLAYYLAEFISEEAAAPVVESVWTFGADCADPYGAAAKLDKLLNWVADNYGEEAATPVRIDTPYGATRAVKEEV